MKRYCRILLAGVIVFSFMPAGLKAQTYIELADSADNYIKNKNWTDAERVITKALRLEPANFGNALLLSNLGYVHTAQGRYKEALENYSLGLAISPKSTVLLTNRARTHILLGEEENALKDIDRAVRLDSTLSDARKIRAFTLLNLSRFSEAEKDFSFLIGRNPKDPEAYAGMAECSLAGNNYEKAISYYSEALEIRKDADYYFKKIYILTELGRLQEASETVSIALDNFPQNGNLYLIRAYISKLNYRLADAERDKKQALDNNADPQFVQLFFGKSSK